jgi:hypothetical protein
MNPSSPTRGRGRIAAAVVGVLFVGVSVVGVATSASAAPLNAPVFTAPAPGPDPDAQPQIEGDLQNEGAAVDVVVTVTNSGGTSTYCTASNIDTTLPNPFFSCLGGILPFGDNTFTAAAYFSMADPGHVDPSPISDPLVYTRYGLSPLNVTTVPASPTTDPTLNWGGTGPELGSVDIRLEDSSLICQDVPIAADGTWSCEGTPLTPTIWAIQVEADDYTGLPHDAAGPFDIVIQPFATMQQTFTPWWTKYDGSLVQGSMSGNTTLVEVLSSPNVGGPFVTPFCSEPGVPDPALTVFFCDSPPGTLQSGDNYLVTRVTASNGEVSAFSAPILITRVDSPLITSPAAGSFTNDNTPTIIGTADDSYFDDVRVGEGEEGEFLLCDAVVQPDDSWQCTSAPLADGEYDPFGEATPNFIYADRVTFTVDTTAPAPAVVNPLSTTDVTPTVTGTGEAGASITVFVDGFTATCTVPPVVGAGGTWSCNLVSALEVGTHAVSARQIDRAGNVGPAGAPQPTLTITTVPGPATPLILRILAWTLGGAAGEYSPGDAVTLTGTGLPPGAIANAEIHSTPMQLGTAMVDATGSFEIEAVIPEDIEPGDHMFVITVTAEGAEPSVIEQPVTVVAPEDQKATIPKSDDPKVIEASADVGQDGPVDRNAPNAPSAMTDALDTVFEIIGNPVVIVSAAAIGLGLLLFVAIPAELLNATLSEQYDRFARRMPRLKRATGWWSALAALLKSTPVVGAIVLTVLSAVIFGFADPGFGLDLTSLRVVIACALGLLVVGFISNALTGITVAKRWSLSTRMELKPLGIILAVLGVVLSRLLEFSPGFLIGLLLGIALVGTVSRRDEVRTTLTRSGIVFGFAIVAWLVYSLTSGAMVDQSFGSNLFLETLVAVTTEGLTALLIGLLPFKYLEGESIWNFSKPLWFGVWLFIAAIFALIVVPNNFAEVNGSLWVWGIVVAAFAVVAIGLYVYFRFFAPPLEQDESVPEEERVGSRR